MYRNLHNTTQLYVLSGVTCQNNIIAEGTVGAIAGQGQYNLAFGNTVDFGGAPGPTNLDVDPMFADAPNGDFALRPTSPAIDAGNPSAAFNDVDGSRNDLGATGGPDVDVDLRVPSSWP